MDAFQGFSDSESFTEIPDTFFTFLLAQLGDPAELKVILYSMWRMAQMEEGLVAMAEADYQGANLGLSAAQIQLALDEAVADGILLRSTHEADALYFLNSPRGRSGARDHAERGRRGFPATSSRPLERPNVFKLYEENIGPLTPLIADALKEAEATYSAEWTAEAIELAVKNNKRNWKYCEAILKRWKEEGRAEKHHGRDAQGYDQRDVEDKIRKFVDG